MELKRILASDARSAIDSATAQYGQDVLVISNHRVNGQTELVVAVDLDEQLQPESPAKPMTASSDFGSQLARIGAQSKSTPESIGHQQGAANGADQREYIRSREIVDLVRDELAALRREFRLSQQTTGWELGLSVSPAVQPLVSALTEAGYPRGSGRCYSTASRTWAASRMPCRPSVSNSATRLRDRKPCRRRPVCT